MNTFNKIEHLKSLKCKRDQLTKEIEAIEKELRKNAGTKEKPFISGCFQVWLSPCEKAVYNKDMIMQKCPEAIGKTVYFRLNIK